MRSFLLWLKRRWSVTGGLAARFGAGFEPTDFGMPDRSEPPSLRERGRAADALTPATGEAQLDIDLDRLGEGRGDGGVAASSLKSLEPSL